MIHTSLAWCGNKSIPVQDRQTDRQGISLYSEYNGTQWQQDFLQCFKRGSVERADIQRLCDLLITSRSGPKEAIILDGMWFYTLLWWNVWHSKHWSIRLNILDVWLLSSIARTKSRSTACCWWTAGSCKPPPILYGWTGRWAWKGCNITRAWWMEGGGVVVLGVCSSKKESSIKKKKNKAWILMHRPCKQKRAGSHSIDTNTPPPCVCPRVGCGNKLLCHPLCLERSC